MPATFEVLAAVAPDLWRETLRRPDLTLAVLGAAIAPLLTASTLWLLRDRRRLWAALRALAARVAALEAERHAELIRRAGGPYYTRRWRR
jgi:hypothetical protein